MNERRAASEPTNGEIFSSSSVIFTIVSANYIGFAATLMQSVRRFHPDSARYIILSDAYREFPELDLAAELLGCDQLHIDLIENMKLWYTVIEFNTAIKPSCFLYFFERAGFDQACYIDPDILLFAPLTEVFDAFPNYSCVLTPHMMHPLQDGKEPSDLTIMKSGVYNLGFLGLKNDVDGLRLARWWADRCFATCRVDIAGNMFTDQRWMDLAPAFVERPLILRHPGYNVAYWNLANRRVAREEDGRWTVDGQPLVFFHFSGIKPDDPKQFSKHTNRFKIEDLGVVDNLCTEYRELVLANKWKFYSKIPYAFGAFANGRPIEDVMRHWIARAVDDKRLLATDSLELNSDFFDDIDEEVAQKGASLTRFMYQFWLDRQDLQDAFNIYSDTGLAGYFRWFLEDDSVKQLIDGRSINAARLLQEHSKPDLSRRLTPTPPLWSSVAASAWNGKSADIENFFRASIFVGFKDSNIRLPVEIALLWERRSDLQVHFQARTAEEVTQYIAWALTQAVMEGCVNIKLIDQSFIEYFTQISSISSYYNDVPITAGLLMTRKIDIGRKLGAWHHFPVERGSRLGHGLWFAFVAPKLFGWPDEFVEPVRTYFLASTDVTVDGFRLPRAAIAIWELRPDVQQTFPLSNHRSTWSFVRWLVLFGLKELGVSAAEFDPRLVMFLNSESPRMPGVSQLLEMILYQRGDLAEAFDIKTEDGRAGLDAWALHHLTTEFGDILGTQSQLDAPDEIKIYHAAVALTGQWSVASGRGEDVRCSAMSLNAAGFEDYVIVDIDNQKMILPDGSALESGVLVHVEVNIVHTNADTAFDNWQTLKRIGIKANSSVGYWAWELATLPSYWRHSFGFYDEIWAATRFAEGAFKHERLRPVKLVPMAVIEPVYDQIPRSKLNLSDDKTIFLFMFDFRSFVSRKNPDAVIEAFLQAFPAGNESVSLIIKTQGGAEAPEEWRRLNRLCTDPRIEIRDLKMERAALLSLIKSANAFVSLHRSEGFGRGPAEAMLLGVPVVATDYSGTADFLAPDCGLLVDYELLPVRSEQYPGVEAQRWAQPSVSVAARHLRWVHENPGDAKSLGERGRKKILEMYNTRQVGAGMLQVLKIDFAATAELVG